MFRPRTRVAPRAILPGDPPTCHATGKLGVLAGSVALCCFGSDAGGRLAVIRSQGRAFTMLSAEKEAHCRRMLEHLTHTAASGRRFAAPMRTDPQFAIHLVGEARRNKTEPQPPPRRKRCVQDANQPDLLGI